MAAARSCTRRARAGPGPGYWRPAGDHGVAAISALSWIFVIYVAFHTGFGGTFGLKPMLEAFTAPLIGVV